MFKIFTFLLLIFSSISHAASSTENNALTKTSEVLSTTKENINKLNVQLQADKKQTEMMLQELQKLEKNISTIANEQHKLSEQLNLKQKTYEGLHDKYLHEIEISKKTQVTLSKQMQLTYLFGKTPTIKWLISNNQQFNINRILSYYQYIHNSQKQKLNEKLEQLTNLKDIRLNLKNKIESINQTKELTENNMVVLQDNYKDHNYLLSSLYKDMEDKNKTLAILQKDERLLLKKLTEIKHLTQETGSNINVFYNNPPHYPILTKQKRLKVTANSNTSIYNNYKMSHFFVRAEPGTPVYAIHDGKIVFADWLKGYGLMLIVDHGNDVMSLYGHSQSIFKQVGDNVLRGETIASVGQSGGQRKPGLYFEIRQNAKPINLDNWFKYEIQS